MMLCQIMNDIKKNRRIIHPNEYLSAGTSANYPKQVLGIMVNIINKIFGDISTRG